MRRLMSLAAFGLVLTLPLWAQGRGGHVGGGGHVGFGSSHMGGFSGHAGGRVSGSYTGSATAPSRYGHPPSYSQNPYMHGGHYGHTHVHIYTYGFRNNCYGIGCRGWGYSYPWWGAAYYPWWWDEQDRQFDEDYYRQYEIANEMNRQSLEQQRMLREQEDNLDAYASRSSGRKYSNVAADPGSQTTSIISPTVLVFRDHHQEEVRNYAIVGETLWNFAPGRTQRIALDDLDLEATEKANEDRGVTFYIPGTDEGQ